jgi:hypothetical protein
MRIVPFLFFALLVINTNRANAANRPGEGNWIGEDTNVELALHRARNSIPADWKEDAKRFDPILTCVNPSAVLDKNAERCVDESGNYQLVRAIIPIRKAELSAVN